MIFGHAGPRFVAAPVRGRDDSYLDARTSSRDSKMSANLLYSWKSNRRDFSECLLMDNANQLDFDSAIRRFESSRPSQPVRSLTPHERMALRRRFAHKAWSPCMEIRHGSGFWRPVSKDDILVSRFCADRNDSGCRMASIGRARLPTAPPTFFAKRRDQ